MAAKKEVLDTVESEGKGVEVTASPPREMPSAMGATFAERVKAREAWEKRVVKATNKAVTAAESK